MKNSELISTSIHYAILTKPNAENATLVSRYFRTSHARYQITCHPTFSKDGKGMANDRF